VKEVSHVHPQSMGYQQKIRQLHLGASLHALNRRPVDTRDMRQALLGHVQVQPPHAYAVADSPACVKDPLGLIGWHAINRLPIMVLRQHQI
jgi:hypothetical protein